MSDFEQNKNLNEASDENSANENAYVDEFAEFETVFSDPLEHKKKAPSKKNKNVIIIVISCLLVAVLGVTIWGVTTFIEVKKEPTTDLSSKLEPKTYDLLALKESDIKTVVVTNKNGTFTFNAEQTITENSDGASSSAKTVWTLSGGDSSIISSDKISSALKSAFNLSSERMVSGQTDENYGFTAPTYTMVITKTDGSEVTVTVGTEYVGQSMYCTRVSGVEGVYLVDMNILDGLDFTAESLYKSFTVSGFDTSKIDASNITNGVITTFDSITVTGKNYPKPLVVEMNKNELFSTYLPYVVTSPESRMGGDAINDLLTLFSSGVSSSGVYSTDVSAASLKKYGLDNPYMTLTMKVSGVTHTIKISALQEDGNYAVTSSRDEVICKIVPSSLAFIERKATDFYGKQVYMGALMDLSNMTFVADGINYSFDIVYNDSEDAEETFNINLDGKKITAEYFQNFYQEYVGLTAADFEKAPKTGDAVFTVTMTYSKDNSKKTIAFYPSSATKYLYTIDGEALGRVGVSEVSRIINLISRVAEGNDVS